LRFIPLSLRRTTRTPRDTRFPRLEFGTFYEVVCKSAFYEAIKIYKRYPWACQREVEPMGSTPSTDGPAHPVVYKIVTFAAIPAPAIGFRLTPPFF
jgi:hypothetical protein